jgi:uroporphyrin-III C-methyltransferase/precorrin-2 dehydrogenase/sirohydrochlorin ferrochelatase
MEYLPLFVKLTDQRCLVVGGGAVARRKIEWLLAAGASITLVALQIDDDVRELLAGTADIAQRAFVDTDVDGKVLVIAATNDRTVNAAVYAAATRRGVLVNSVDDAAASTAIFPSIVNRNPVIVAISTGGRSPTLARRIRSMIEARLPPRTGTLAEVLGGWRTRLRSDGQGDAIHRRFWEELLDGPIPNAVYAADIELADSLFDEQLLRGTNPSRGFVSLVGAGPGDADLLTLRALQCIERADVIFYDNLVAPEILERARRDARKVYVGKRRAFASVRQESINAMLVEAAQQGERVVRLKGGDPFIFGRGGEEIETLSGHGVPFEVVPGITAALGCASYANIPLTHRDWSQSVRFVAGNLSGDRINLDWPELARAEQTLVIYMGSRGVADICHQLTLHGMDPETPAALIVNGTLPGQRVIEATVATLAHAVAQADPHGPTIIIIGRVVALRGRLTASQTR